MRAYSAELRPPREIVRWMVWPAVVFTVLFFVMPLIVMACVSFWDRQGSFMAGSWTVQNYVKFFTRDYLLTALVNSIEVTLITTIVSVLLAYPFAYVLAFQVPARWQKIILLIAVLPFWTSYVVRSYSWLLIVSDNGFLNRILMGLGLISEPLKIAYTRSATILGFVHFFVMLLTLTIYANLAQISPSYIKAAQDLGASWLTVIRRIILPLSVPGVAVGAFLTFVITIGDYVTPQILGGNTAVLVPQAIMLQIVRTADFPMASVISLVLHGVGRRGLSHFPALPHDEPALMGKLSTHSLVWAFVAVMLAFIYLPVVVLVLFSFQSGDLPVPPLDGQVSDGTSARSPTIALRIPCGILCWWRPLRGGRNAAWFPERLRHVPPQAGRRHRNSAASHCTVDGFLPHHRSRSSDRL